MRHNFCIFCIFVLYVQYFVCILLKFTQSSDNEKIQLKLFQDKSLKGITKHYRLVFRATSVYQTL